MGHRLDDGSCMSGDVHVQFCERLWGKFLWATLLVILHENLTVIQKAKRLVQDWLTQYGLELKESKTRISHTLKEYEGNIGFDFLGFTIRQFNVGKLMQEKNIVQVIRNTDSSILKLLSSQVINPY